MREREPQLIIGTGTKGVGKTHTTCCVIEKYSGSGIYARGGILQSLTPARRVLIYDVNMEYVNEEIRKKNIEIQTRNGLVKYPLTFNARVLSIDDLPAWVASGAIEVRRILPLDKNGSLLADKLPYLEQILHYYRGGLLVLDDINNYLVATRTQEIINTITTNRHKDLDIYIHLQTLAKVTPSLFENTNVIRFHKQFDSVKRYANRVPNPELFFIAEHLVNNIYRKGTPTERFYVYINKEYNIIQGKFSIKQFHEACRDYVVRNPAIIRENEFQFMDMKFDHGVNHKMAVRKKAMEHSIIQLTEKYYGNPTPTIAA